MTIKEARSQMVIRKTIGIVFNAFLDPSITSNFWFTNGTGKLVQGSKVDWIWEMYNLTVPVFVEKIVDDQSIVILWGEGVHESRVHFSFKSLDNDKTFVEINNFDFKGTEEEVVKNVIDSIGGFNLVLAGLKSWLEHGINLNLIADKVPMN